MPAPVPLLRFSLRFTLIPSTSDISLEVDHRLQVRDLATKLSNKTHQLFSVVHNGVPAKVSWFRLCAAAAATARCTAERTLPS